MSIYYFKYTFNSFFFNGFIIFKRVRIQIKKETIFEIQHEFPVE